MKPINIKVMRNRHSWISYNGNVAISAKCTVCGCIRQQTPSGREYILDGKVYPKSPECDNKPLCYVEYKGFTNYSMNVDYHNIEFCGKDNFEYFKSHYEKLGYKIILTELVNDNYSQSI